MDMAAARATLVQESRELLSEMESALLEMERDGASEEGVHAVFRAAHTIKGSAGLFGLEHVVRFTHSMETVLDGVRAGRARMTPELVALMVDCGDHLSSLIDAVEQGILDRDPDSERAQALLDRLSPQVEASGSRALTESVVEARAEEIAAPGGVLNDAWHISLRLAKDVLKCGMDPMSFLNYLSGLGEILAVGLLDDDLPPLSELDPELLHLGIEVRFSSDATRQQIEAAFEFVSDGSIIRILPPHARIEEYLEFLRTMPETDKRLGEILVSCGALTPNELEKVLAFQRESGEKPIGKIFVEERMVPPVVVETALRKQAVPKASNRDSHVVKVEAEKLDALIDLVGELVIASATARVAALDEGAKASAEAVGNLATLVEEIRDSALGLRMVPIGEVFQRFPRMVRDISRDLGKSVELRISGAEAELDKSMVDRIADPLTHIVRNSLDHGLETEAVRIAAGKPAQGTLSFNAYHETGSIVIEVSDDGAGIRRDKVLAKAIERGLVQPGQELSDREILNLVFEAGFSTADSVSDLSGRGVGMDVVRRNIEALRGEIELESVEGAGTTMRLRLPLTLAIIDGFQFLVGKSSYVVPLDMVKECADLVESDLHGGIVRLRGESLPVVHLRKLFSVADPPSRRRSLVVAQYGAQRVGLLVDQLAGELQAVIKPLGPMFRDLRAVGGTTILGNGAVALILDIPRLAQIAAETRVAQTDPREFLSSNPAEPAIPAR